MAIIDIFILSIEKMKIIKLFSNSNKLKTKEEQRKT